MKKTKLILFLSFGFLGITAQIGVNTDNPQTVFHLDGRSSVATTNPSTGVPSAAQQADDFAILSNGRVGIGTITPGAKLEINTQGVGGVYPVQINDGGQAVGKFLVSDVNGTGSWRTALPTGRVFPIQTISTMTFNRGIATQATGSTFTVPKDGFYSFEVRWWSQFSAGNTASKRTITVFQLRRNNVIVDQFQYNSPLLNAAITTYIPLYTPALKNEVLSLWVYPDEAPGNIITNNSLGWTTSKVLVKELQVH